MLKISQPFFQPIFLQTHPLPNPNLELQDNEDISPNENDDEDGDEDIFGPDFGAMRNLPPRVNLVSPNLVATNEVNIWYKYGKGYVDNTPANAALNMKLTKQF